MLSLILPQPGEIGLSDPQIKKTEAPRLNDLRGREPTSESGGGDPNSVHLTPRSVLLSEQADRGSRCSPG